MSFINSTKSSSKVCTEIPVSFEASDSASGQWKVTLFVNNLFPFKVWKNLNLNRWISVCSFFPILILIASDWLLTFRYDQNKMSTMLPLFTVLYVCHYFLFHSFLLKMFEKMLNKTWRRGVGTTNGGDLERCWVVMTTVTVLTVRSRAWIEPSQIFYNHGEDLYKDLLVPSCHIYLRIY